MATITFTLWRIIEILKLVSLQEHPMVDVVSLCHLPLNIMVNAQLLRLHQLVDVYHALVYGVHADKQLSNKVFVLVLCLPIARYVARRFIFKDLGIYFKRAHLFDKILLLCRKQTKKAHRCETLTSDEFDHIELVGNFLMRLLKQAVMLVPSSTTQPLKDVFDLK